MCELGGTRFRVVTEARETASAIGRMGRTRMRIMEGRTPRRRARRKRAQALGGVTAGREAVPILATKN